MKLLVVEFHDVRCTTQERASSAKEGPGEDRTLLSAGPLALPMLGSNLLLLLPFLAACVGMLLNGGLPKLGVSFWGSP